MPDIRTPVRLKFCGGCNPAYDRRAMVQAIRDRCGHRVRLVTDADAHVAGVLVVAGCQTACVDSSPFAGLPVVWVTGTNGVGPICRMLGEFHA